MQPGIQIQELLPWITLFSVIATVGGSWFVARYQIATLKTGLNQVVRENKQQWEKADSAGQEIAAMKISVTRHETMLDPQNLNNFQKEQAGIIAELKYLRRDVDALREPEK